MLKTPDTGYAEIHYINAAGVNRLTLIVSFEMPNRLNGEDIENYKHRAREHIKTLCPEIVLTTTTDLKWKGHSHYRHGY